ncbi:MAG: hypothetical protein VX090_07610, partial [Pseudomonadota bacterium]|nr:hypothetical protein [Pseudomonadota bacterium]
KVNHITSFDIDPSCALIADSLNADAVERRVFSTVTADILQLRYTEDSVQINDRRVSAYPDLLINTSCEHLEDFDAWFRVMPQSTLLVLQSNDYFSEAEHVNCQPDLAAFQEQAPMRELIFAGELEFDKYTRFMLIGRR